MVGYVLLKCVWVDTFLCGSVTEGAVYRAEDTKDGYYEFTDDDGFQRYRHKDNPNYEVVFDPNEFDWSEAPEGATHWDVGDDTGGDYPSFVKISGSYTFFWSRLGFGWIDQPGGIPENRLVEKPSENSEEEGELVKLEVGQKWRVVNSDALGYSSTSDGDIFTVDSLDKDGAWDECGRILTIKDIEKGSVELVEPEDAVGDTTTSLLWQVVEGSGEYDGHGQLELKSLPLSTVLEMLRSLEEDDHLKGSRSETIELRLVWQGDHMGFFGGALYAEGWWADGEHPLGHRDRLLVSIEKITGLG